VLQCYLEAKSGAMLLMMIAHLTNEIGRKMLVTGKNTIIKKGRKVNEAEAKHVHSNF